jgi:hypothetical protein
MEDLEEVDENPELPARKFHAVFVLAHLFAMVANMLYVMKLFFGSLAELVTSHSHYLVARDEFEASAGAEIERLVNGEVDG